MNTEIIFENIIRRICLELDLAKNSIFIGIEWLKHKQLFDLITRKAKSGVNVKLINTNKSHVIYSFEAYNYFNESPLKINKVDSRLNEFLLIDCETAIIDSNTCIQESEKIIESIIITKNNKILVDQIFSDFNILESHYSIDSPIDLAASSKINIKKKLELIKSQIDLKQFEELKLENHQLIIYNDQPEISEIILDINEQNFATAKIKILKFLSQNHYQSLSPNPFITFLKIEIKILEFQLNVLDNDKIELEKILASFQRMHTLELGELILEIMKIKKDKLHGDWINYNEAENDEKEYRQYTELEKSKKHYELTTEQKSELKRNYRKASILCHPDKFVNETLLTQIQAEEIFKELNAANFNNDLVKVSEILARLEKGILSSNRSSEIKDTDILKSTIDKLKYKVAKLGDEIHLIKKSQTFLTITSIEDWDSYFKWTKHKLQEELFILKNERRNNSNK